MTRITLRKQQNIVKRHITLKKRLTVMNRTTVMKHTIVRWIQPIVKIQVMIMTTIVKSKAS